MKRILIIGLTTSIVSVAMPAGAQAACGTACLRGKVSSLTREVKSLTTRVGSLSSTVSGLTTTVTGLGGTVGTLNTTVTGLGNVFTALHGQEVTDEGTISTLQSYDSTLATCLAEAPVTEYGDPSGTFGYEYDNGSATLDTTALDGTASGDPVSAWILYDQCNTTPTAQIRRGDLARAGGALAPSFWLTPFAR
jgi:hypothetical protein